MISESLRAQLRDTIYDEVTKNSFTAEDSVVDLLDEIIRLREQVDKLQLSIIMRDVQKCADKQGDRA